MLPLFVLTLAVALLATSASAAPPPAPPRRIAIVGCGIGGAAASFYMQDLLRNNSLPPAGITAFEASDRIGGRLKHIIFGPQQAIIEVGGAAWTSSNQYVKELARRVLNLTVDHAVPAPSTATPLSGKPLLNHQVGVWRGPTDGFANLIKEVAVHADSVLKILSAEDLFLNSTAQNYQLSAASPPFTSISEFIAYGNIEQFTNTSIHDYFAALNVNKNIVEDVLVPINRAIYNQNDNSSAFSMFGSLTALINHESVPTGNSDLVKALFKAADATTMVNEKVVSIQKNQPTAPGTHTQPTFTVTTSTGLVEEFDAVMIAAPLEVTNITWINFDNNINASSMLNRHYYPWYVTVVEADRINPTQFQPQSNTTALPHILLTNAQGTTATTPWVCIQPVGKHGKNGTHINSTKNVFLIYSDQSIQHNVTLLKSIVVHPNMETLVEQHWPYTFAHLYPTSSAAGKKTEQPIVLSPGIYNLNALESLASAMEVSSIAAHNSARLAYEYLYGSPSVNPTTPRPPLLPFLDPQWQLVWFDEFEGNALNLSKWTIANNFTHCYPPDPCDEDQLYLTEGVQVNQGTLKIITKKQHVIGPKAMPKQFTSGWIDSKNHFAQRQGRFEINCSMPSNKATGVWPAFWLLPSPSSNLCWPTGGEIDVFEFVGNPLADEIFGSYHWGTACSKDQFPIPGKGFRPKHSAMDWQTKYHVYAIEWNATALDYYVDNELYFTRTATGDHLSLPATEMYIIINQGVGVLPPTGGAYPKDGVVLEVDYVRVYTAVEEEEEATEKEAMERMV
jgi:beta-glucanase (GH16 family)